MEHFPWISCVLLLIMDLSISSIYILLFLWSAGRCLRDYLVLFYLPHYVALYSITESYLFFIVVIIAFCGVTLL